MKRLCAALIVLSGLASSAVAQDGNALVLLSPLPKVELADGDCIVFLGDSITHQCLYTQYVEDYFYTRMPHLRLNLHNAGVGGARAWDALARMEDDVASYQPKFVTILLGMNDGTYRPFHQETFDTYEKDMTDVLKQIKDAGAVPILMTPTMFDSRASRIKPNPRRPREEKMLMEYNSVLTYYGTWCREVATNHGFGFVDMWSPLNNITIKQRKKDANFTLIRDAIHPDAPGQVVMATSMITDMGLPRQVSNIRIWKSPQGKWQSKATGGDLTELQASESEVSFTWNAKSLPWVLPEEAQLGVDLTKLGHKLSKEAVSITGLEPGRYSLAIDGTEVGTFTHEAFARHIELQGNSKTPQYQQALKVAMLNKTRNETAVRPMRNQWGQFQGFARNRRAAEEQPDNKGAQDQFAKMKERMEGHADRVAELVKSAKEQEDEIFNVNQPVAHKYTIKRVVRKPAKPKQKPLN